jgi:glycerol-3-phosphate acyltransferase PlsY
MILGVVAVSVVAYLVGCIPTAWIALKLRNGADIRTEGSGNVGARNVYDVSGSSALAFTVAGVDALKGVIVVAAVMWIDPAAFYAVAAASVAVVAGHTWNVFLGGKGGRGLATALGVFAVLNPVFIVIWGAAYLTGYYVIRRNMHIATIVACIGAATLAWSTPDNAMTTTTRMPLPDATSMRVLIAAVCFVLFVRQIEPVREFLKTSDLSDDE